MIPRRFNPRRFTRQPQLRPLTLRQIMDLPGMHDGTPPALSVITVAHAVGAAAPLIVRPPNPTDGSNYVNMDSTPLFADPISIHDIGQGQVSDCWELAAAGGVALLKPEDLRLNIVKESPNVYRVRFIRNGIETWVYTSADVPDNGVHITRSLWPAILEKACAYYRRGMNTYASLNSGFNYAALLDMGFSTKTYAANAAGWAAAAAALAADWPVAVGTTTVIPAGVPLISNHSHTLISVGPDGTLVFYNPWGFDGAGADSNPADGTVTTTITAASPAITLITCCTGFTPPLPFAPSPAPAPPTTIPTPTPTTPTPPPTIPTPEVTMPPTAVITSIDHTTAKPWDLVTLNFTAANGTPTLSFVPGPRQSPVIDFIKGTASFFMPESDVTITLACTSSTDGNTAKDSRIVTATPSTPPVTPDVPAPTIDDPIVSITITRKSGKQETVKAA